MYISFYRSIVGLLVLGSALTQSVLAEDTAGSFTDPAKKGILQEAEYWHGAALSRQMAALRQEEDAEEKLRRARQTRSGLYDNVADTKKAYLKAGDLSIQAGGLESRAASNYSVAAGSWTKVAEKYAGLGELYDLPRKRALEAVETLKSKSLSAYENAIAAYLSAAKDYSRNRADNISREAQANEKAAQLFEKLGKLKR